MVHPVPACARRAFAGNLLGPTIAVCAILASGCATTPPPPRTEAQPEKASPCAAFAEQRKNARYATAYRLSPPETENAARNFKGLPAGETARARHYTVRFDQDHTMPCTHLVMRKELYLQRTGKTGMTFQETREFYSGDGTLIAVKNEQLSNQLAATGYYVAAVPLPIPPSAPAGNYRVVSKLVATNGDGRAELLASASANFLVTVSR
jgi:hypothetical protein